ncbi:MAG: anthranilate synthase component I family protein [Planctomycetota bacterium]
MSLSPPLPPRTIIPACKELATVPKVADALRRFARLPWCLLFESAREVDRERETPFPISRYSFLVADPVETLQESVGSPSAIENLKNFYRRFEMEPLEGLPPFQGGLAGLFSYDLNQSIELIPSNRYIDFQIPSIAVGMYDVVLAWDHWQARAWLISLGIEADGRISSERAQARLSLFESYLNGSDAIEINRQLTRNAPLSQIASPQFATEFSDRLTSNFQKKEYLQSVQKCIDYIDAGDVFQINLAQRLLSPAACDSIYLYENLKRCNPAPFASYFQFEPSEKGAAVEIVSSSPERFLAVRAGKVESRPIKGTRRRTGFPIVDLQSKRELMASEKDFAENTMIVDLMRNDLSRVCLDDSVLVSQFCQLEEYESVLHLVSAIEGTIRPECDLIDLLACTFPGGSITGAPKIRAMEIIAELEPTSRGAYCGSIGYLGFNGNADLSILIRTITACDGWWQIPVGGGIVSQSDPMNEYEETWTKATGMLKAIFAGDDK